jgi:nitroreductase
MADHRPIISILDLARWAPSGDNTQPWSFEIVDDMHVVVHGFDTRDHCVYDLNGRPSQISLGALLQTMEIAATLHGWSMRTQRRTEAPETKPTFDVWFAVDASVVPGPLAPFIEARTVQRRPMQMRRLTAAEKSTLEAAVGQDYAVRWIEGFRGKLSAATLMFRNAKLRLTMPEAYEVHRSVIAWGSQYSDDKVPDQALGAGPLTLRLMRFVLGSWKRVRFFNRFLAGTWAPRIQMDLIPGLACAGHLLVVAKSAPKGIDDWIEAGRAVQRLWLTATKLGLLHQPEMTPLIFSAYVRDGTPFSRLPAFLPRAVALAASFDRIAGQRAGQAVWMGRIGAGTLPTSRSLRMPLAMLLRLPEGIGVNVPSHH